MRGIQLQCEIRQRKCHLGSGNIHGKLSARQLQQLTRCITNDAQANGAPKFLNNLMIIIVVGQLGLLLIP